MPRVPTYDEFQAAPQVAPAARVEAAATPQMMSVAGEQMQQTGRALVSAGNAGAQIVLDIQKDINEANTRKADNAFARDSSRIMADYMTKVGEGAVVDHEATQKALVEAAQSAGDSLQNDMQRRMYHDVASRRVDAAIGQINMHAATQAKQWNINEATARATIAKDDAANNWYQWKDDFSDMRVHPDSVDRSQWGARADGSSKGMGFLGPLKNANGSVSTELSIGVNINGKDMEIPTLVPTLSRSEVNTVLNLKEGQKMPEAIVQKAVDHAKQRIAEGKDVFAGDEDGPERVSNRYTSAKATMISEVNTLAANKFGAAPDSAIAKSMRLEYTTGLHADTIGKMIVAGESAKATDYLESATRSGEIDPSKAKFLDDMVKQANVGDESTRLAMSLQGSPMAKLATLDKMFANHEITEPVFKAARGEVEHRWQLQKTAENDYEKSVIGSATNWAINNPSASIQEFRRQNPTQYDYLMSKGRLHELDGIIKSGGKVANDGAVWAEVMTNQSELKTMTPTEIFNKYSMKLDEPHLEKLYAINAALNGSKDEQHLSIFSTAEMVKDSATRMGILPATGKPNDSQVNSFNQFQLQLDARIAAYEANELGGKRKASQQELKKILQEVEIDKVYRSRSMWPDKSDVPLITVKPNEMDQTYVIVNGEEIYSSTIPASQRSQIIPALKKAGRPVTEQNIADYWVRGGKKK